MYYNQRIVGRQKGRDERQATRRAGHMIWPRSVAREMARQGPPRRGGGGSVEMERDSSWELAVVIACGIGLHNFSVDWPSAFLRFPASSPSRCFSSSDSGCAMRPRASASLRHWPGPRATLLESTRVAGIDRRCTDICWDVDRPAVLSARTWLLHS